MYLKIFEYKAQHPTFRQLEPGKTSWIIGRADECDILVSHVSKQVSRRHAFLRLEGGKYILADTSMNGTFLDGIRIAGDVVIKVGQVFTLGDAGREDGGYCKMMLTKEQTSSNNQNQIDSAVSGSTQNPQQNMEATPKTPQILGTQTIPGNALAKSQESHDIEILDGKANNEDALYSINDLIDHEEEKGKVQAYYDELIAFEKEIHTRILADMHLAEKLGTLAAKDEGTERSIRERLEDILKEKFQQIRRLERTKSELPIVDNESSEVSFREKLKEEIFNNIMRLGPITPLLDDKSIDEVMVNGHDMVFVERNGIIEPRNVRFYDDRHLISIIQRIVEKVGRHIDEASPMVDARLADGSRVNAIIPPLAIDGPSLTIRKFKTYTMTTEDLIKFGTMSRKMADFLRLAVKSRQNILISGGTGSGKTTLLNVLGEFIPQNERLVVIEDSAELRLTHVDKVRLESRPANIQGQGRVTIRDLLVNSLRMRPDRIIIGECRSGEALDMLQAMNTGHDGSLTTVHANSPRDALSRLENMVLMAGYDLPVAAIREQTASAINLVIQQNRLIDGSRKIVAISEVTGKEGNVVSMQDIFVFEENGIDPTTGKVMGSFKATKNIPHFIEQLRQRGYKDLDMTMFENPPDLPVPTRRN